MLGMLAFGELAGGVRLDIDSACAAIEELGRRLDLEPDRTAQGVMQITAASMSHAIRAIFAEVGEDPREAALIAFGGAGPLFGTLMARELGVRTIVVPNYAGNFSAWGLLLQDLARSAARTVVTRLSSEGLEAASGVLADLGRNLAERGESAGTSLDAEGLVTASLDLRYEGQEYFLTVEVPYENGWVRASADEVLERFARDYEKRYGHTLHSPVAIVAARLTAVTALPKANLLVAPPAGSPRERRTIDALSFARGDRVQFGVADRDEFVPGTREQGPLIVLEETATTYVDAGFELEVDPSGVLLLHDVEGGQGGHD